MIPADRYARATVRVYTRHLDAALDVLAEATRRPQRAVLIRARRQQLHLVVDAEAVREAHDDLTWAIAASREHMAIVARAAHLIKFLRAEGPGVCELPTSAAITADLGQVHRAVTTATRLAGTMVETLGSPQ